MPQSDKATLEFRWDAEAKVWLVTSPEITELIIEGYDIQDVLRKAAYLVLLLTGDTEAPRDSARLRVVQKPASPGDMADIEITLRYELYAALLVRLYRVAERQDNGADRVWLKQFLKDLRAQRAEGDI